MVDTEPCDFPFLCADICHTGVKKKSSPHVFYVFPYGRDDLGQFVRANMGFCLIGNLFRGAVLYKNLKDFPVSP